MLDPSNYDPRPLRVRIPELLARYPLGLSTKEIAELLGDPQYTVSAIVSKMATYGIAIEKTGSTRGRGCVWRLKRGAIG